MTFGVLYLNEFLNLKAEDNIKEKLLFRACIFILESVQQDLAFAFMSPKLPET